MDGCVTLKVLTTAFFSLFAVFYSILETKDDEERILMCK
jgi:hypothetical protein